MRGIDLRKGGGLKKEPKKKGKGPPGLTGRTEETV